MGDEEERRIRAESLSVSVPLVRMVLMKARSEVDRVLVVLRGLPLPLASEVSEPAKVSPKSSSSLVALVCMRSISLLDGMGVSSSSNSGSSGRSMSYHLG